MGLFLELMVIRWVPGSVRLVAYFANLMLISSFLGLGLGAMLASRGGTSIRWFPSLLAVDVLFLAFCRNVLLPGSSAELRFMLIGVGLINYIILLAVFVLNTGLFVPLGEQIGQQFQRLSNLRAYGWDLCGSLAGTLIFGGFAVLHFSPQVGLFVVVSLFALLYPEYARQVRTAVLLVLALAVSVVATERRAVWSAYSYLSMQAVAEHAWHWYALTPDPPADLRTMQDPPVYALTVNQFFYQYHRTLDLRRFTTGTPTYAETDTFRVWYDIPYAFQAAPRKVAVAGGGGGLDVETALLHGAERVDVVEIDPAIIRLARRYSAAGAYDDPRVSIHVDDARAFFERATPGYDLVTFGLLDSHGLFSSMANVRLDGFVYTVEGIRAAWGLLNERGTLALSFAVSGQPWLAGKLYRMIAEATGREPLVYAWGLGWLVMIAEKHPRLHPPEEFRQFARWYPAPEDSAIPAATDDWPYLYLRARGIPSDYALVILSLLAMSVVAVTRLKSPGTGANELHFGAMGAGFLLLETKSIVDSSLYFGTTWIVSLIVIAGVLLMVLLANALAGRVGHRIRWLYVPLIGSILVLFAVPNDLILGLSLPGRIAWTALAVPIPILFAGLIFSATFKNVPDPSTAFGANLIGAMVGGFAEYLSMATGRQSLVVVVVGAYLVSLCATSLAGRAQVSGAVRTG